jgi:hypothetical protein
MEEFDPADAILDDVFVLWRALEWTFPPSAPDDNAQTARSVIGATIDTIGIEYLTKTAALVKAFRHFESASPETLREWFQTRVDSSEHSRGDVLRKMSSLRQAATPPLRWTERESRLLGELLYGMRCAVVHSSLDTNNVVGPRVLPALRAAMIELVVARAASYEGIRLHKAWEVFGDA